MWGGPERLPQTPHAGRADWRVQTNAAPGRSRRTRRCAGPGTGQGATRRAKLGCARACAPSSPRGGCGARGRTRHVALPVGVARGDVPRHEQRGGAVRLLKGGLETRLAVLRLRASCGPRCAASGRGQRGVHRGAAVRARDGARGADGRQIAPGRLNGARRRTALAALAARRGVAPGSPCGRKLPPADTTNLGRSVSATRPSAAAEASCPGVVNGDSACPPQSDSAANTRFCTTPRPTARVRARAAATHSTLSFPIPPRCAARCALSRLAAALSAAGLHHAGLGNAGGGSEQCQNLGARARFASVWSSRTAARQPQGRQSMR